MYSKHVKWSLKTIFKCTGSYKYITFVIRRQSKAKLQTHIVVIDGPCMNGALCEHFLHTANVAVTPAKEKTRKKQEMIAAQWKRRPYSD